METPISTSSDSMSRCVFQNEMSSPPQHVEDSLPTEINDDSNKKKARKKKKKPQSKRDNRQLEFPLYRLGYSESCGRHAIASQPISQGTCVLREKPFDFIITGHMHVRDEYYFESKKNKPGSFNLGSWFEDVKVLKLTESGPQWITIKS